MKITLTKILVTAGVLVVLFCGWMEDARENRIEANLLMMCQKQMGPGHCYHGALTDPYPGFKSS